MSSSIAHCFQYLGFDQRFYHVSKVYFFYFPTFQRLNKFPPTLFGSIGLHVYARASLLLSASIAAAAAAAAAGGCCCGDWWMVYNAVAAASRRRRASVPAWRHLATSSTKRIRTWPVGWLSSLREVLTPSLSRRRVTACGVRDFISRCIRTHADRTSRQCCWQADIAAADAVEIWQQLFADGRRVAATPVPPSTTGQLILFVQVPLFHDCETFRVPAPLMSTRTICIADQEWRRCSAGLYPRLEQKVFEKYWAHSPLRAAALPNFTLPFTRCRYCRYCRTPPAHRCPRQRQRQQRQRVTGNRYGPMEWAQSLRY